VNGTPLAPRPPGFPATLALALALAGCRGQAGNAPAGSVAASAATPGAAAPSAAPAAAPSAVVARDAWYAGAWTGTYQSTPYHIDLPPKQGGLPEWKVDDPKRAVGRGTLTLTAQPDGTVVGAGTGALGEHTVRGAFDGDALAAELVPKATDGTGFAGTFVAHRDKEQIVGTLQASSTDGHLARTGTLTLTRSTP
jgi:hypothetical protein